MNAWEDRLQKSLAFLGQASPEQHINQLVDLAMERADAGESHLTAHPELLTHFPQLRILYESYIAKMELQAVATLLAGKSATGSIAERTDSGGRLAYRRVDDLFEQVDFRTARRFVMVGCGRFPATALQAAERFPGLEVEALDTDFSVLNVGRDLTAATGLRDIDFQQGDGATHDFSQADIVFVANMVSPKAATLRQALNTGRPGMILVVREPYGLGRLWAERAEDKLDARLQVISRGPGSRFLSRNVFLGRIKDLTPTDA